MQNNGTQQVLPVAKVLPRLLAELNTHGKAILSAPPGSGKTTLVPGALLDLTGRKIVMLEPRRMAAKLAASYIASRFGEKPGGLVGYRVRGESTVGKDTRIEIVTEGVLVKMLQSDPELADYGAVVFDEFHERNLAGDLALAFALDVQSALRADLKILLMSATLAAEKLSCFLADAPVVAAEGRVWPLTYFYADEPFPQNLRELPKAVARLTLRALNAEAGNLLVFLPGVGEIEACAAILSGNLPENVDLAPLYGQLPLAAQMRAVAPPPEGRRKIVLATNIAESSVTIDGIRVVVDSGFEKSIRRDIAGGADYLALQRISKASAIQRGGRAGRQMRGSVYSLYTRNEFRNMVEFTEPEILVADLAPMLMEVAQWGSSCADLRFVDAPPAAAMAKARADLQMLGLMDSSGRVTERGKAVGRMDAPPRIGVMLLEGRRRHAEALACELAALCGSRVNFSSPDLAGQLAEMRRRPSPEFARELQIYRNMMHCGAAERQSWELPGVLIAAAYPEFVARQRARHSRNYLMRNGREAVFFAEHELMHSEFLAILRIDGAHGFIRAAAALSKDELEVLFAADITEREERVTDGETGRSQIFCLRELGGIELARVRRMQKAGSPEALCEALCEKGLSVLNWSKGAQSLLDRVRFARRCDGDDWPDWSEKTLLDSAAAWLLPFAPEAKAFSYLGKLDLLSVLSAHLGYDRLRALNRDFPENFVTPAGATHRIGYESDTPVLSVRLGELYGLSVQPTVGRRKLPLKLELLSPAMRPVQITCDLPGFWAGSYKLVQKEMKSRYPKHLWPDDPAHTAPTLRAKPRR